jgi:HD-GYP domain-containing protein (c-di-GMP phosphodiesterase class II)
VGKTHDKKEIFLMTYYNDNHFKKPDVPLNIQKKWQIIVDLMAKIMEVPAALIMKVDPPQIEVFISSKGEKNPYEKRERADLKTGLYCETVTKQRSSLLIPDARKDPEWDHNPDIELGMVYYYGFPLEWPDRGIFGTICVLDYKNNLKATNYCDLISEFRQVIEGDLNLIQETTKRKLIENDLKKAHNELKALNFQLEDRVLKRTKELEDANRQFQEEIIIRKKIEEELKQSYEKLQKTMEGAINAIGNIVGAKDPYTADHQQRVCQLTVPLAQELGLSEDKIEGIRVASLIHDIGKINVPTEILSKTTTLSDIEFSLIKIHSQIGSDILKSIDFSYPIDQIVLQHHERLNGSGYPNKLKGDKILFEAKIIGVADVVEAMSSHRPYRPALGIDAALEEIIQNRGILYDPEIVDVCLRLFKEKGFKFK